MSKSLDNSQADLVRWLGDPQAYPHDPQQVEHVETHISHLFLAGEYVYKLKKPLHFDFLDYSTIDAREHACREELRLNRRLAPDTYLEVIPVVRDTHGGLRLGGEGEQIDWLVWMRRLPTESTLAALYERNELRPEHIDRVADTLVRFYRGLKPLSLAPEEYARRCESHVRGNREELLTVRHHLPRGVVERVHGFQLQQLLLRPELFEERVRAGRIVDGHGDLRPEHICIADKLAIFDCIEFSADFRRIDIADELAFLAAECDFLGGDWIGPRLMASYQSQSGDNPPEILLAFYKSYRACVRAKVAALRADQLRGAECDDAVAEANRHLKLADRYVGPWLQPLLLVVGGLSGTGKTTLASKLAAMFGAELLHTDVARQRHFGAGPTDAKVDAGIYQAEAREQVYKLLLDQAAGWLESQIPAVLDGTFSTSKTIRGARKLADDGQSQFLAIECYCRPEIAHQRINLRRNQEQNASDATPEVHDTQRTRWEPWPDNCPSIRVNTEEPLDNQIATVIKTLRQ